MLAALVLALDGAALAALAAWPAHLAAHLLLYVAAGLCWMVLALRPRAPSRWMFVAALGLHAVALASPPRHSDDYHRYLWDGVVQRAGIDPYRYSPDDEALRPYRTSDHALINNRELPTVYPPGAQLAFRISATLPLPPLVGWKLLVGLGELCTALLLYRRRPALALLWLASPLVLVELDVNAHVEAIGLLPFAAALVFLEVRPRLAGFCLGLASAVKLLPVYLFAFVRKKRVLLFGVLALVVTCVPYASAHMAGSLGEYGRRWRTNDGAFAVVLSAAKGVVAIFHPPLGRWDLGAWGPVLTGRPRPDVYPDELAGFLARAIMLVVFAAVIIIIRKRALIDIARIGLGAFLLLTPSLHPWYALWLLPPLLLSDDVAPAVTSMERLAWLWLVALVPLGHAPLVHYLQGQPWHDPIWTRVLEHGPPLVFLSWPRGVVYSRAR